jgi:hypothetical protein
LARGSLIALALLLACATTAATVAILRYKQGHLASLEWRSFEAPDGSYAIDLLGEVREVDSKPDRGERRYASEGWYSGIGTWIAWRDLTAAEVQEASTEKGWVYFREKVFEPERDRLKDELAGSVSREATIGQKPLAFELRLDGKRGPTIQRTLVVAEGAHPRIYFIGMSGKKLNFDGPEVKRLFASFRTFE